MFCILVSYELASSRLRQGRVACSASEGDKELYLTAEVYIGYVWSQ